VQAICSRIIESFALDGNECGDIYVGQRTGDEMFYAGKVDHGFDKASATDLHKLLTPLIRKTQAHTKRIEHEAI
jgi:bifunctional non-homologous end joining protein LigD